MARAACISMPVVEEVDGDCVMLDRLSLEREGVSLQNKWRVGGHAVVSGIGIVVYN
jgi:hypothetical protein